MPTRASSFPFVSGDGFRLLADVIIEHGTETSPDPAVGLGWGIVFADTAEATSDAGIERTLAAIHRSTRENRLPAVILHNGDAVPSISVLEELASVTRDVLAVNILDGVDGVSAVPIGLENAHHDRNGRLQDFLSSPPFELTRDLTILASFSVGTNPGVRRPLRSQILDSRFDFVEPGLAASSHQELVRRALVVISPPGNGPDCHRTWEAVALGAVPVVLRGTLAESLAAANPIHVVDDYSEVLSLSDEEIRSLHHEVKRRRPSSANLPYWIARLARTEVESPRSKP